MQESWKDELSSLSLAIYVWHTRYFAWLLDYTKRFISYSSFPIPFLCLISLFFPCTYTATLHFLLWLSQRNKTQETLLLPFPTGPCKSEICTLLYSFSLKESARKLSWVFPQVHGFTHQKKTHFIFIFSQRNQKTLSHSLPFFHEWFYVYFPPQEP